MLHTLIHIGSVRKMTEGKVEGQTQQKETNTVIQETNLWTWNMEGLKK